MKKIFALLLVLSMVFAFAACAGNDKNGTTTTAATTTAATTTVPTTAPTTTPTTGPDDVKVLTYAEYAAIEVEPGDLVPVVIEFYVQATQSWWDNKITVYGQDADGGYFAYEMTCSEEDAAKLVPGTKIRVTGNKTVWDGEYEIASGSTFEFVEGADSFIAEAFDATALLGTDELIQHQNKKVAFKGLTIKEITYKNGEPGDDIYVTVTLNDKDYSFCVERYLTGPETDVYTAFATLTAGDVVDIEGFLYWYQGPNPHITAVAAAN